jgi:ELWxxDGT repeat protein
MTSCAQRVTDYGSKALTIACWLVVSLCFHNLSAELHAQVARLVKDINQTPSLTHSSYPSAFAEIRPGLTVFSAFSTELGEEPWITDGTPAGTGPLRDIAPGRGNSDPVSFVKLGGAMLFRARDDQHGTELWRTDGTAQGTFLVKDIRPGLNSGSPVNMSVIDGVLYFSATTDEHGQELWRSDGTAAGTMLVCDALEGPASSSPFFIRKLGPSIICVRNSSVGAELWKFDGTCAGMTLVKDIRPGPASSNITSLVVADGKAYFQADNGVNGPELWVSDGTESGTFQLLDANPGSAGSTPTNLLDWNGQIYYFCVVQGVGRELWRTDGTPQGTSVVVDLVPGATVADASPLVPFGQDLYFVLRNALWRTDGTGAGTTRVSPSTLRFVGLRLIVANGHLYFPGNSDGSAETWLWKSDGTSQGTTQIGSARMGDYLSGYRPLGTVGQQALFISNSAANGWELWKSDGTVNGTALLRDINEGTSDSSPDSFSSVGTTGLLLADDGVHGKELHATDGTSMGTRLVADYYPGPIGSRNSSFLCALDQNAALFALNHPIAGPEPVVVTGSPLEVIALGDLAPGSANDPPRDAASANGKAYISISTGLGTTRRLAESDGTAAGTHLLPDFGPLAQWQPETPWASTNHGLLFFAKGLDTRAVSLFGTGNAPSVAFEFDASDIGIHVEVEAGVFFVRRIGQDTRTLWFTDGTADGTIRLLSPNWGSLEPRLLKHGNKAVYTHRVSMDISELWTSDGTVQGTQRMFEPGVEGPSSVEPLQGFSDGDIFYFLAQGTSANRELWKTDGTPHGTRFVQALPGRDYDSVRWMALINDRLFYTLNTSYQLEEAEILSVPITGGEVRKVTFASGDAGTTNVSHVFQMANSWYFVGTHPKYGRELFILGEPGAVYRGACCLASSACSVTTPEECAGSFAALQVCQPTSCCTADFNLSRVVNIDDIFEYLLAWFNGNQRADIDTVPGLRVDDLFVFINLWFAGC